MGDAVLRTIDKWLLEYAFKHNMKSAVSVILSHDEDQWKCHPIWSMLYTVQNILQKGDAEKFELAMELMSNLFEQSQNVIAIKLYAKIVAGLKIMSLFYKLKNRTDDLMIAKMNEYFPRTGFENPLADDHLKKALSIGQKKFRQFFLTLLACKEKREEYLNNQLESEFGTNFLNRLRFLVEQFVNEIKEKLPLTTVERLITVDHKKETWQKLSSANNIYLEMLLDVVQGQMSLEESEIIELLTNMRPCSKRLPSSHQEVLSIQEGLQLTPDTDQKVLLKKQTNIKDICDTDEQESINTEVCNKGNSASNKRLQVCRGENSMICQGDDSYEGIKAVSVINKIQRSVEHRNSVSCNHVPGKPQFSKTSPTNALSKHKVQDAMSFIDVSPNSSPEIIEPSQNSSSVVSRRMKIVHKMSSTQSIFEKSKPFKHNAHSKKEIKKQTKNRLSLSKSHDIKDRVKKKDIKDNNESNLGRSKGESSTVNHNAETLCNIEDKSCSSSDEYFDAVETINDICHVSPNSKIIQNTLESPVHLKRKTVPAKTCIVKKVRNLGSKPRLIVKNISRIKTDDIHKSFDHSTDSDTTDEFLVEKEIDSNISFVLKTPEQKRLSHVLDEAINIDIIQNTPEDCNQYMKSIHKTSAKRASLYSKKVLKEATLLDNCNLSNNSEGKERSTDKIRRLSPRLQAVQVIMQNSPPKRKQSEVESLMAYTPKSPRMGLWRKSGTILYQLPSSQSK